jgi:tRNA pseudouridine55 synthase
MKIDSGILNIYKPSGISSSNVVKIIKHKLNVNKIGHCGCLDPLAEGVLVICFGNKTKLFNKLSNQIKVYETVLIFTLETDTDDISGKIINYKYVDDIPTIDMIKNTLLSFVGDIEQIVPIYSAVKLNGRRFYEYARDGKYVDPKIHKIKIYEIELIKYLFPYLKFRVKCSAGTYIRSLCRDIGRKLDLYATMCSLIRLKSGEFTIENSIDFTKIKYFSYDELIKYVITNEFISWN